MYAVIESGGKQYRLEQGDFVDVELLNGAGETVEIEQVLLIGGDGQTLVGSPYVKGAKVLCQVEGQSHGPKLVSFKYKKRKNQRRKVGHRQHYTRLRVTQISVS